MKHVFLSCALLLSIFGCSQKKENKLTQEQKKYETELVSREKLAGEKEYKNIGVFINSFSFQVKNKENEITDWASIENAEKDLENLIDKDVFVIPDSKVTIAIDYPLKNEFKFQLESKNGFTRKMLLSEISKNYYKLYKEEEESATIKTQPMEQRVMYNRNETNGKYGIWGHDIADLVLTDIYIYKDSEGKITLVLGIDS